MNSDFLAFLQSMMGLRPRGRIADDGKWHFCDSELGKRRGSWKLLPGGRIGFGQDWRVSEHPSIWRADGRTDTQALTPVDREALRNAEDEHRRSQAKASAAARSWLNAAMPIGVWTQAHGVHPYLTAKMLTDGSGIFGLKVDKDGWICIPAYRGREVVSLQRIAPDGTKRFWPGAPIARTWYKITRNVAVPTIRIYCEGWATGAMCWRAVPGSEVIVCWSAHGMAQVVPPPSRRKGGLVVVAADNDHGTEQERGKNPGLDAGRVLAERLGCGVAYPQDIEGTDFADFFVARVTQGSAKQYKGRPTQNEIERNALAEIRRMLMAEAKLLGT